MPTLRIAGPRGSFPRPGIVSIAVGSARSVGRVAPGAVEGPGFQEQADKDTGQKGDTDKAMKCFRSDQHQYPTVGEHRFAQGGRLSLSRCCQAARHCATKVPRRHAK